MSARCLDYTVLAKLFVGSVLRPASAVIPLLSSGAELVKTVYGVENTQAIPHMLMSAPSYEARNYDKPEPITVLFVGFWGPAKGIGTLVSAIELIERECPGRIRLNLTGGSDGSVPGNVFTSRAMALVNASSAAHVIETPGYLTEEDLQNALGAADIIVQPYMPGLGPSASGPLLLAMSAGLPIIASETDTFKAEISHGKNGMIVPHSDPSELAAAIKTLTFDPSLRQRPGSAARGRAIDVHDRKSVALQYADVFDRAMG